MISSNPTVWLTLQARDARALIDYLVNTFGFTLSARYGDGDVVAHAELLWPEGSGGVMLGSHKPDDQWCRQPGAGGGYVVTADPSGLYDRVLAGGGNVVQPLGVTDYGSNEFSVRDIEGNLWSFGDYTGATADGH